MSSKGFTLIELIVVMAVFLFIIGAAIGIFISVVQNQRIILSQQELLNQTSYVEEYMSKALRMAKKEENENCLIDSQGVDHPGYSYLLTRPNSDFYQGIKFINASDGDTCQEFFLDNTDNILKEEKNNDPATITPLTSSKIKINSIRFGIDGTSGCYGASCPIGDQDPNYSDIQPRVTIFFDIQVAGDTQQPTKKIQTTVSQRNLNAQ